MGVIVNTKPKATTKLVKPMVAKIDKKHPDGSEVSSEETIGQPMLEEPCANVSFKMGLTKNMGDYNSLRVDVMLSIPCVNSAEGVNEAYDYAKDWVDQKLTQLQKEIEEG